MASNPNEIGRTRSGPKSSSNRSRTSWLDDSRGNESRQFGSPLRRMDTVGLKEAQHQLNGSFKSQASRVFNFKNFFCCTWTDQTFTNKQKKNYKSNIEQNYKTPITKKNINSAKKFKKKIVIKLCALQGHCCNLWCALLAALHVSVRSSDRRVAVLSDALQVRSMHNSKQLYEARKFLPLPCPSPLPSLDSLVSAPLFCCK